MHRGLWCQKPIALILAGTVFTANSGCTLFSSKDSVQGSDSSAFTSRISTNSNEMPVPVEINNDIGRIMAGGSASPQFESSGGRGVNVNVNVNFNGTGWQKMQPEVSSSGGDVKKITTNINGQPPAQGEEGSRQPAQDGQVFTPEQAAEDPATVSVEAQPVAKGRRSKKGSRVRFSPLAAGETQRRDGPETYVVKPGDTLMKISFEKFGNVYRWREILASNREKITNISSLTPGTELTINGTDYVVVMRNGKPYLIRRGDTLGKISRQFYGVSGHWRDIWKNNPQLIRDPNKIYAGFTLYYQDKSELRAPAAAMPKKKKRSK
jgi:nucleoid-associated protein YgaU